MNKSEILAKLQEIFCDILDNEEIVLQFGTIADDIEEWDSLSHVMLIVEIEKIFNVKFSSSEMHKWCKVEDIIDSIINHS